MQRSDLTFKDQKIAASLRQGQNAFAATGSALSGVQVMPCEKQARKKTYSQGRNHVIKLSYGFQADDCA